MSTKRPAWDFSAIGEPNKTQDVSTSTTKKSLTTSPEIPLELPASYRNQDRAALTRLAMERRGIKPEPKPDNAEETVSSEQSTFKLPVPALASPEVSSGGIHIFSKSTPATRAPVEETLSTTSARKAPENKTPASKTETNQESSNPLLNRTVSKDPALSPSAISKGKDKSVSEPIPSFKNKGKEKSTFVEDEVSVTFTAPTYQPRLASQDTTGWEKYDPATFGNEDNISGPSTWHNTVNRPQNDCEVCADTFGNPDCVRPDCKFTPFCNHHPNYCKRCCDDYIQNKVSDREESITCPGKDTYNCDEVLLQEEIKANCSAKTFEEYDWNMARRMMIEESSFIPCPYSNPKDQKKVCRGGHFHDDGGNGNYIVCGICCRPYCAKHKVPWHKDGETCEDYDNRTVSEYRSTLDRERDKLEAHDRHLNRLSEDMILNMNLGPQRQTPDRAQAPDKAQAPDRAQAPDMAEEPSWSQPSEIEEARRHIEEQRRREEEETQRRSAESARVREAQAEEARRREQENKESENAVHMTSKSCPSCGSPTERRGGCMHITCKATVQRRRGGNGKGLCHAEWCWGCGNLIHGFQATHGQGGYMRPAGCTCGPSQIWHGQGYNQGMPRGGYGGYMGGNGYGRGHGGY